MRAEAAFLALASLVLCIGCTDPAPERPQWVVVMATNARVPQLGDWLLVDVLTDEGLCEDCRRTFGAGAADRWPISFGVMASEGGAPPRVRAVLFRSSEVDLDGLPAGAVIETVAELPPTDTRTDVGLVLDVRCFGVESDLDTRMTCDPETGTLVPEPTLAKVTQLPVPESWPGFAKVDCALPIPEGQVCVPGGAFLLGGPSPTLSDELQTRPEHLVTLSPFAIDQDEMTVGELKKWLPFVDEVPLEQDPDFKTLLGPCTFVPGGKNDDLAVNCVSHSLAERVCDARGQRLPTEAEFEYVAGNLELETKYPWGADSDVCDKAVLARGRTELESNEFLSSEAYSCRVTASGVLLAPGVQPGGGPGDVTALGVHDLGGNLAEWVADRFGRYDDPCWDDEGSLLNDPMCDELQPGNLGVRPTRGGSWRDPGFFATALKRNALPDEAPDTGVGFRCVTPR